MARFKWKSLLIMCVFSIGVFISWKFVGTESVYISPDNGKKKLILQWTRLFHHNFWLHDDIFKHCPVSSCRVTTDKKQLNRSDVVVFHPRNMHEHPLPSQKWKFQRWLLFSLEPPYLNGILPQKYNNLFNWTMTYREDSDFVYSYNEVKRLSEKDTFSYVNITLKTKLAVARSSNCFPTNKRLEYIQELQKSVHVDFFGKCAGSVCSEHECNDAGMKKYKFYLAFENGNCRNYISEKFWNALLTFEAVPVVMGGSSPRDYILVAPPGSYINTADFSSPKELAAYLVKLDKDDQLYMEYHNWRKNYTVALRDVHTNGKWKSILPPHPAWCDLCGALHNSSSPPQVYTDLEAWYSQDTCPYDHQNVFCTAWNHCCFRKKPSDIFTCF
ncbi:glycoprotein 3-alpha-L-fucosyltransferase A-like [Liolophura sinensis]|uniref:glycoprotein 3-alpha-L-fucosyltransferase A-like n=1 Tax=Liolophura sinensis TaxID=3198878 RepID=UPI003157FE92